MADKKRKSADPIIFLGVLVLVLVFCVSWSFRMSDFIAGSFRLDEVQICEELDENLQPINLDRNMPSDSTQVCIWFSYSNARRGDLIEIIWYRNENIIQREITRLVDPRGVKAFYLLREDGSPLESGFYTVQINCNGREKLTENFTIAASDEDFLIEGNFLIEGDFVIEGDFMIEGDFLMEEDDYNDEIIPD